MRVDGCAAIIGLRGAAGVPVRFGGPWPVQQCIGPCHEEPQ